MTTQRWYYSGVGSRNTPRAILERAKVIASGLKIMGWTVRSGHADGFDMAVEEAATHPGAMEIFLPWNGFNDAVANGKSYIVPSFYDDGRYQRAEDIARTIHPAFDRLSQGDQKLHTRNVFQVLGRDLSTPSKFVLCYAPIVRGDVQGGTRTAIHLARRHGIPIFNLYYPDVLPDLTAWLRGHQPPDELVFAAAKRETSERSPELREEANFG